MLSSTSKSTTTVLQTTTVTGSTYIHTNVVYNSYYSRYPVLIVIIEEFFFQFSVDTRLWNVEPGTFLYSFELRSILLFI